MKRALGVLLCAAVFGQDVVPPAFAQDAPDLAALEQTAQKRHAEWEALAKDMNDRMARILPCDPRALTAVTEVSRASEARLAALADYLRAVSAKAFAETAAARNLLSAEERRAVEASLERADAGQEQTAVDMQSDALAQSVKQRTSLEAPQKLLAQIAAMIHQRATRHGAASRSRGCGRRAAARPGGEIRGSRRGAARGIRGVRSRAGALERILCGAPDAGADRVHHHADRGIPVQGRESNEIFTPAVAGLRCAAGLIGQTGRDAYRQAYDVWQQAQTNLERDAGTGGSSAGCAGRPFRGRRGELSRRLAWPT